MVGWHHQLNGHDFKQTLRGSKGQGSLVCCSPWGLEESATTERLNELEQLATVHLNVLDAGVAARVLVLFVGGVFFFFPLLKLF